MSKNIVILFDGTSNEISADRSNILRLFGTLEQSERQVVYYDPGVGTFGAGNAWSKLYGNSVEVWGHVTGWGLDQNVKEAYRFLIENYDAGPTNADGDYVDRDRIYIFGFSRGAYSARVLAGFIHALGFMSRNHLNLLNYAYSTYKGVSEREETDEGAVQHGDARSAFASMRLYERTLKTRRPPIRLLGLFDTVASVIEPGKHWLQIKTLPFTHRNSSVEWVRHAVAMDERRTMFQPELWPPGQDYRGSPFKKVKAKQNAKEVWFSGVHGDIGGGYPEAESDQVKIPLDWMIRETAPAGLHYLDHAVDRLVRGSGDNDYVPLNPLAALHDPMTFGWRLLEAVPRRVPKTSWRKRGNRRAIYIPCKDRRFIPDGAMIHDSVRIRMEASTYDPPNLPRNPLFVS